MEKENPPKGSPALLKGLFFAMAAVVLASAGYALWIVVIFWDRVSV